MKIEDAYVIEVRKEDRNGRGRFWGPEFAGYTNKIALAGIYSHDEAFSRSYSHSEPRQLLPLLRELAMDFDYLVDFGLGFECILGFTKLDKRVCEFFPDLFQPLWELVAMVHPTAVVPDLDDPDETPNAG